MNKSVSIYLDLVRFVAAVAVFLSHANYEMFTGGIPFFWRFSDYGHEAVMVFFVLSGLVITYVADQKEHTLKEYAASRLARLYSVAIPALILTIILDHIGAGIDPDLYNGWWSQRDNPIWRFTASTLFINELWFSTIRPFSNGPFWSLGYEFWYYVIFATFWYLKSIYRYTTVALVSILTGPKILIMFPIWLLGTCVYYLMKKTPPAEVLGWVLFTSPIVMFSLFRHNGYSQELLSWTTNNFHVGFLKQNWKWSEEFLSGYIVGILIAVNFLGFWTISHRFTRILSFFEKPIRYLAGYTLSIYLFHYPLLIFFAALPKKLMLEPINQAILVVFGSIIVIWLLGGIAEPKKTDLRIWFLSMYDKIETFLVKKRAY